MERIFPKSSSRLQSTISLTKVAPQHADHIICMKEKKRKRKMVREKICNRERERKREGKGEKDMQTAGEKKTERKNKREGEVSAPSR